MQVKEPGIALALPATAARRDIHPKGLTEKRGTAVAESPPTGRNGQLTQFGKRKGTLRGKTCVMFGHGFAVNKPGHGEDSGLGHARTTQIGDQGHPLGQFAAAAQQADGIAFIKVMQYQVAKHDIEEVPFGETEKVCTHVTDLGKTAGKLFRNLQCRLLPVHRRNHDGTTDFPGSFNQGARNITGPGAKVEHSERLAPGKNRPEVIKHQSVCPKETIERLQICQIGLQLRRDLLGHVHPLGTTFFKTADHGSNCKTASIRPVRPRSTRYE